MGEEVELLEHHADVAAHLVDILAPAVSSMPSTTILPCLDGLELVDAADQRRLAGARGAADDDLLATADARGHVRRAWNVPYHLSMPSISTAVSGRSEAVSASSARSSVRGRDEVGQRRAEPFLVDLRSAAVGLGLRATKALISARSSSWPGRMAMPWHLLGERKLHLEAAGCHRLDLMLMMFETPIAAPGRRAAPAPRSSRRRSAGWWHRQGRSW